uniref:Solute carrier family 29 member 1b n=1 Tax=Lepisosteus oculatus TaxID=7918 RepID=W5NF21_LEPOC
FLSATLSVAVSRYRAVWLIFFILGLGTLLPWNFFMTATMYFTSRLKDEVAINITGNLTDGVAQNYLEAKFNNFMTLCAMLPLLLFTCLNSFLHQKIPQKVRIMGSLFVILFVFVLTAAVVKISLSPVSFFTLTMIKIICINFDGVGPVWRTSWGYKFYPPHTHTHTFFSGQGGMLLYYILYIIYIVLSGSELQDSSFGYFITACVVIIVAIVSYVTLPKLDFFLYYSTGNSANPAEGVRDEETKLDLLKKVNSKRRDPLEGIAVQKRHFLSCLQIWVMALSVCFVFTVTIGTFPAVTADVKSTIAGDSTWGKYFIPVSCFLLFNLLDWAGRSLTAICMWPGKDSKLLPILVVARVVFVPLFMLCNVQMRVNLPVIFAHDVWFIIFMIVFAFSNGYLASLCMCFGPKKVPPHEAETAGAIMAFFLSLGLALGAALSFLFRAVV